VNEECKQLKAAEQIHWDGCAHTIIPQISAHKRTYSIQAARQAHYRLL